MKPVSELAGKEILQSYVGSSANPGLRDFGICALILKDNNVHEKVSFDINPSTRQVLENLIELGLFIHFIRGGARIHEPGCNGCIGMGQAPPTNGISLRTVPRNFPGRSGTKNDQVYLCSPETATASAITGVITDPRTLDMNFPKFIEPIHLKINTSMLIPPPKSPMEIELRKGPNIKSLPTFFPLSDILDISVILKVGDNISTDEIMPAGAKVLPFRSNIPEISKFVFNNVDKTFYNRAMKYQNQGFAVIGGENYGQGSSREHAAIAPRFLGLKVVIAKSFARIHWQNLINFGIIPLEFKNKADWDKIDPNDQVKITNVREAVKNGSDIIVFNESKDDNYNTCHNMSGRQIKAILEGSLINLILKAKKKKA